MCNLAVKVGWLHKVRVHNGEGPNARTGKVKGNGATQAARTNDECVQGAQLELGGRAKGGAQSLAGKVGGKRGGEEEAGAEGSSLRL